MCILGRGHWTAFLRRNSDKLVTARGTRLDDNRAKWETDANFQMMNDLMHQQFVGSKIIIANDELNMRDSDGQIENDKDEMVGLATKHELKHPDYLLVIDEVGSNLHCDHDNNVGGEKCMFAGGYDHTTTRSNNNDCRFSLLGFTIGDGKPVMCVSIVKAEKLHYE